MKKLLAVVVLLLLGASYLAEEAEAQRRRRYAPRKNGRAISRYRGGNVGGLSNSHKYKVIGLSFNAFNYFGDLSPISTAGSTDISFTKPGVGILYGQRLSAWATARGELKYGRLQGDDFESQSIGTYESLTRYARNLQFRSDILELTLGLQIDLIPNYRGAYSRAPFTPFIFLGITGFSHEPKALAPETDQNGNSLAEAGQWVKLRELGTEGQFVEGSGVKPYSNLQIAIPLGLGFKLRLPNNFDAVLEFGYRYLFTDYIDDVSGNYPDLGALGSNLARALSDRSTEQTAVVSGGERDFEAISSSGIGRIYNHQSEANGESYRVLGSFGTPPDIRGNSDNDMYFVTQLKIHYILSGGRGSARRR